MHPFEIFSPSARPALSFQTIDIMYFIPFSCISVFLARELLYITTMDANTEKIALPLFGERIAPRLDTAQRLRFVTVRDGTVEETEDVAVVGVHPLKLAHWLKDEGVGILICCGIDRMTSRTFLDSGILLIPRIGADANQAVHAYINGTIETLSIIPVDGPGRGRRHHGGRCGRFAQDDNSHD